MRESKLISTRTLHQTLACLPVLFNQFLIGVGWGWTAPTLIRIQSEDSPLQMNANQISWIVSMNEIGRIGGPFVSPFIVDNIGRCYSLSLVSIVAVLIWLGHIFVRNFYLLCVIRLIFGITNGLQDVASPIYMTENCSAELRKMIALIQSIVFNLGISLELILALNLTYQMTALVNALLAICTLSTLYFCVETPQYSIMKGKHLEAEKSLAWLQGGLNSDDLAAKLETLRSYVQKENEKRASMRTLLSHPENVRGIGIVFCINFFSTAIGGIAVGTYITEIFSTVESPDIFLYMLQVVKYLFMITSPFLISKIKNIRASLILAFIIIGFLRSCTGILFYVQDTTNNRVKYFPWVIFTSIAPIGVIITYLTNPVQYVLRGELLPLSVRAWGGSVAIITSAATGVVILKIFYPISNNLGIEMNFWLYAIMAYLLAIILYFCLPAGQSESTSELQNNEKNQYQANNVVKN